MKVRDVTTSFDIADSVHFPMHVANARKSPSSIHKSSVDLKFA